MLDGRSGRKTSPFIDIGRFRAYRNRASRPRGGVVTQRTANPRTPVQFRAWPPALKNQKLTDVLDRARRARRTSRALEICSSPKSGLPFQRWLASGQIPKSQRVIALAYLLTAA
jgi:hypothetical protein